MTGGAGGPVRILEALKRPANEIVFEPASEMTA